MSTIIRLTIIEMKKKKILYLILILTALFLLLYGILLKYVYGALHTSDHMHRILISGQVLSMGMYAVGFITSFFAIFSSVGAIASEIDNGGYDAILSKPIARYEIISGKFLGILSILIPYTTFIFLSVIVLNTFFGQGLIMNFSTLSVIKSLLAFYMLPILLTAMGMFLSVSLSTIGSGIILVVLYFCGMIGGIVEQMSMFMTDPATKSVLSNIGIITSLVIPTDVIYRRASSLLLTTDSGVNFSMESMIGGGEAVQPSSYMTGYIILYAIMMFLLALRIFQKRDL